MEQLFSLPAPSSSTARTATMARSGADRDRFDAAMRDAIGERGRGRSGGPADRPGSDDRADRAADRADRAADRRSAPVDQADRRAEAGRADRGAADGPESDRGTDATATSAGRRPGGWVFGQLAREIMAQLNAGMGTVGTDTDTGTGDGVAVDVEATTTVTGEALNMLADVAEAADLLAGTVAGLAEDLEVAVADLVAGAGGEELAAAVDDDAPATELAEDTAALLAELAALAAAAAPVEEEQLPADEPAPADDVAGATDASDEAAIAEGRQQGPADAASPRAAERAGERGPGEPVRANEAGPPRSPRAAERVAESRIPGATTKTEATLTDEARLASTSTEGLRSSDAPRAEAARQTTMPSSVQRVLDLVAQLEKMPPPRQLVLEIGDLKVRVGLDDGQVRLTVLSGDQRDADSLLADAREALAEQGFDLAGDGSGEADADADDAEARPGERSGTGPSDRSSDRARAQARTAGLRL